MTVDIAQARELAEKATEGPWLVGPGPGESFALVHGDNDDLVPDSYDNFAFTAAARTLVPQLCDEVERLRAELEKSQQR